MTPQPRFDFKHYQIKTLSYRNRCHLFHRLKRLFFRISCCICNLFMSLLTWHGHSPLCLCNSPGKTWGGCGLLWLWQWTGLTSERQQDPHHVFFSPTHTALWQNIYIMKLNLTPFPELPLNWTINANLWFWLPPLQSLPVEPLVCPVWVLAALWASCRRRGPCRFVTASCQRGPTAGGRLAPCGWPCLPGTGTQPERRTRTYVGPGWVPSAASDGMEDKVNCIIQSLQSYTCMVHPSIHPSVHPSIHPSLSAGIDWSEAIAHLDLFCVSVFKILLYNWVDHLFQFLLIYLWHNCCIYCVSLCEEKQNTLSV